MLNDIWFFTTLFFGTVTIGITVFLFFNRHPTDKKQDKPQSQNKDR